MTIFSVAIIGMALARKGPFVDGLDEK
jgi:hypothetical protein